MAEDKIHCTAGLLSSSVGVMAEASGRFYGILRLIAADICGRDVLINLSQARENESCGKTTYVHCKAGRGRSTTVVLCYLVELKHMTPDAAYEYVRFIRLLLREFQASGFEAI
ncbi:hypothetical protein Nepgr_032351 [Nepenthes gracilis]|uniref:Tyrosine specific protein phosphatases domain-containing protein n=1 Tax=Nepenthes gracilis TaxID=150966 RepID=A0AAD3Y5Z2_NEPGR|nr:hypothetical protein Nepgr_032351 [Nepenthes gracilis]